MRVTICSSSYMVQKQWDIMICEHSESELDNGHHELWKPKLQSEQ